MGRSTLLIEKLQESAEIRAEKVLEIIRRCFGPQNPVGFVTAPVTNRGRHPAFHACQSRLRKVLNDSAILLKLCKRSHGAKCSAFGTFLSAEPRQTCPSS